MKEWQGVSEFVAVAEEQSFTRAAQRMHMSTAHVSRQIGELEQRLGAALLYRTTRRVTLTEAGQMYYQACRPILDNLHAAELAVNQLQSIPQGQIRITAPVTFGEQILMPLLNEFLIANPALTLHCELTNKTLDLLEDEYDLAIRIGRIADTSLIARQLSQRKIYTCASPEYLQHEGTPQLPVDLHQHNCLIGTVDSWRFRDAQGERSVKIRGSLRCNSGSQLKEAALRGMGIVQLPDHYVADAIQSGQLVEVLASYAPPEEGIWVVCLAGRQHSPKVRALMDWLIDHF
ncbi:MAG: LysR substrate-binding domain-containing protein [Oleibacter sp.]|nr:LysR substrate-binding domain-containing protein [Thalassolituus sp.]